MTTCFPSPDAASAVIGCGYPPLVPTVACVRKRNPFLRDTPGVMFTVTTSFG